MTVAHRKPNPGLIFHSDRGIQYASESFREDLKTYIMVQSMSRKGDCWDNACADSFFSTLKMEGVYKEIIRPEKKHRNLFLNILKSFIMDRGFILFLTIKVQKNMSHLIQ